MKQLLAERNRDFRGLRDAAVRPNTLFDIHTIREVSDREGVAREHEFEGENIGEGENRR